VATAYSELFRRVFIGFPRTDGEAVIAVEQGLKDAIQAIASLEEATTLLETDITSSATQVDLKEYHLVNDLLLTRPKDIYSIRLDDDSNSRKLEYITSQNLDEVLPYPENTTSKPIMYTRFGDYIELFPIPDAVYSLKIRYSKWPVTYTNLTELSPYGTQWDHIIVFLAKDIANSYLNGDYISAGARAGEYLKLGMMESKYKPDNKMVARPFNASGEKRFLNNYYEDPFVKSVR
jgi:hypothetical protein